MRGWILALAIMASGAAWAQAPTRNPTDHLLSLGEALGTVIFYRHNCLGVFSNHGGVARIESALREQARHAGTTDDQRGFMAGAQALREAHLRSNSTTRTALDGLCGQLAEPMLRHALNALMLTPAPPPGAGPPLSSRRGD